MEKWRQIPGSPYWASSEGRVRGPYKILRPRVNNRGRARVRANLYGGGFREYPVHHLVLWAFHGPAPDRHQANHIDGDPLNNRAENLEWVTRAQNWLHLRELRAARRAGTVLQYPVQYFSDH